MKDALYTAMDKKVPFSWIKNHKVQVGDYSAWSQEVFADYEMKKYYKQIYFYPIDFSMGLF